MKIKTRPYLCDKKTCVSNQANWWANGKYCMWNIDKNLVELAMDEEYRNGMCPFLRKEVEKIIAKIFFEELSVVPINLDTEEIKESWRHFLPGTHREDIWHWFEEQFDISIAELMEQ